MRFTLPVPSYSFHERTRNVSSYRMRRLDTTFISCTTRLACKEQWTMLNKRKVSQSQIQEAGAVRKFYRNKYGASFLNQVETLIFIGNNRFYFVSTCALKTGA